MKWFKHYSDSHTNLKHRDILNEFGTDGYAIYWVCLEIIAQQGENYCLNSSKSWKKAILDITRVEEEKVDRVLNRFAELNLICHKSLKKDKLYIPKMKEYADEYSVRVSRQSPDNLLQEQNRIDKNRIDKILHTLIEKKGWDKSNKILVSTTYKRNVKAAKELLLLLNNDEYAVRAVRWVADMCGNKGLNWGLETVIKWIPDFMTKYPIPDNTPKEVKTLLANIGTIPLNRTESGQISTNEVKNEPSA